MSMGAQLVGSMMGPRVSVVGADSGCAFWLAFLDFSDFLVQYSSSSAFLATMLGAAGPRYCGEMELTGLSLPAYNHIIYEALDGNLVARLQGIVDVVV